MSTYSEAKKFIYECTSKDTLYSGIRKILSGPNSIPLADGKVKELQCLADAKYAELEEADAKAKKSFTEDLEELAHLKEVRDCIFPGDKRFIRACEDFIFKLHEMAQNHNMPAEAIAKYV